MAARDFSLDFTGQSGVPSQWGITIAQVIKWFSQQSGGINGVQIVSDRKRGVFNVTSLTKEAGIRLSSFKLIAEKEGRKIEIPLKERRRRLKPPVWISINRTCEGKMADLPNSFFDDYLKGLGAIIVEPTKRRKYRDSMIFNGQREVLVEIGDEHIARQHFWEDEEEESHGWHLTYRGQPFKCRNCNDNWHMDGKCPKWVDRRNAEKKEGQQKFLFFSSSMLRRATDTKDERFDCIPGAKIGHIANHLNNDVSILPRAEVVVVWAGHNMTGDSFDHLKAATKAQSEELATILEQYGKREDKEVFLVDPAAGPTPDGDEGDEVRFLRAEIRRCAETAKADFIPLEDLEVGVEDMDDEIHLSAQGTKKVLGMIKSHVKSKCDKDILVDFKVADRPYAAVKSHHFKFGCHRCTFCHPG